MNHTRDCNDLTKFECEAQATGNRSYVKLQKHTWKNSWNHLGWTSYFRRVFAILNHCATDRPPHITCGCCSSILFYFSLRGELVRKMKKAIRFFFFLSYFKGQFLTLRQSKYVVFDRKLRENHLVFFVWTRIKHTSFQKSQTYHSSHHLELLE